MKRFLIILFVVAFIAAIPLSHNLMAKKPGKVDIRHATHSVDLADNPFTLVVGHVISVSEKAVKAHLKHGDFLYTEAFSFDAMPGGWFGSLTWREIAENVGANTAGSNCAGFIADQD